METLFKTRTKVTVKQKLNVIFLTYSSLTDFSRIYLSQAKVGRQLCIPTATV